MSKFFLENEYGITIDLQDEKNYCIATDITGFGINYEATYIAVGDLFFRNNRIAKQSEFKMNLNFTVPYPFEKMQKVGNFLTKSKELILIYIPDLAEQSEYRRNIEMTEFIKISKQDGMLTYQFSFLSKSLFYSRNQNRFLVEKHEGEMRFNFRWPVFFNDYSNRTIHFVNDGHVPASYTLEIDGYTEKPKIEILKNGESVHLQVFDCIIKKGDRLQYSTLDGDLYYRYVRNDGKQESLINRLKIEENNFFKLPQGTVTIRFTSDTGMMNRIFCNIYKFFKVV